MGTLVENTSDTKGGSEDEEMPSIFTHHNQIREVNIAKRKYMQIESKTSDKQKNKPNLISSLNYYTREFHMYLLEPKERGVKSSNDYKVTQVFLNLDQIQYVDTVDYHKQCNEA